MTKNVIKGVFLIPLLSISIYVSAMNDEKKNDSINPFAALYGIDFKPDENKQALNKNKQILKTFELSLPDFFEASYETKKEAEDMVTGLIGAGIDINKPIGIHVGLLSIVAAPPVVQAVGNFNYELVDVLVGHGALRIVSERSMAFVIASQSDNLESEKTITVLSKTWPNISKLVNFYRGIGFVLMFSPVPNGVKRIHTYHNKDAVYLKGEDVFQLPMLIRNFQ